MSEPKHPEPHHPRSDPAPHPPLPSHKGPTEPPEDVEPKAAARPLPDVPKPGDKPAVFAVKKRG